MRFEYARKVRVVALDLPTSHMLISKGDDMTSRFMEALNAMMLDMLAAVARKDYEDRRRRAAQGVAKAKLDGKYAGRPANAERNAVILSMIDKKMSWTDVCKVTGASRSTLSRLTRAAKSQAIGAG